MAKSLITVVLLAALVAQDTAQSLANELRALADRVARLASAEQPSTSVAEPGRLQAAIDAAAPGTTVWLRGGTAYPDHVVIRKSVTLDTQGLTLPVGYQVTDADKAAMASLTPANNGPQIVIAPGTAGVSLARIYIARSNANAIIQCGSSDSTQTTVEQMPRDITITQVVIEGDDRPGATGAKRGIEVACAPLTVRDSRIVDIRRTGQDTQAIGGWNTTGPITIENNYLEAAGENIMFGGADPTMPGVVPRGLVVRRNVLTKDLAWKGTPVTVKNAFELKAGVDVTIEDNILENVWVGQGSYAVQFTVQSQDGRNPQVAVNTVRFRRNTVRNVGGGINVIGWPQINSSVGLRSFGFEICENEFQIDRATYGGQGWALFASREVSDVTFCNNTVDTNGNQVIVQDGAPVLQMRVTGNLFVRSGVYGISGYANGTTQHRAAFLSTYFPGGVVSGNAFGSFPTPSNLPGNLHMSTAAMLPLIVNGYGTGVLEPYGRRRVQ